MVADDDVKPGLLPGGQAIPSIPKSQRTFWYHQESESLFWCDSLICAETAAGNHCASITEAEYLRMHKEIYGEYPTL